MITIGIDPGKRGALVALGDGLPAVRLLSTCYAGPDLVPSLLVSALRDLREAAGGGAVVVAVEAQQSMPRQGLSSTFRTGCNYGRICGVVEALGWPLHVMRPQAWRKAAGISVPRGSDPKSATIAAVSARLPDVDLLPGRARKPHDGIADAAGLALALRS